MICVISKRHKVFCFCACIFPLTSLLFSSLSLPVPSSFMSTWGKCTSTILQTSWQRPLTLAFGLLLAQAAYVTCEFPGYERVTWMSSLLPVVLLALQPLIEQWPRGEIDSTAGEANNYYPGGLVSTSSSSGNTSGSGKGKAHPPSEDRSSKMKSKSKTASSKKAN